MDATANVGSKPSKIRIVQNPNGSSVTAPAISPGEPVAATPGSNYVFPLATSKPVAGTDYISGISEDFSSESGANNGIVHVSPVDPGAIYLCTANNTALIATQTLYNALVGARVTFNKSAANNTGVYTVNLTDGSTNGLVVEYSDVIANPGKVAFSFRVGTLYNY